MSNEFNYEGYITTPEEILQIHKVVSCLYAQTDCVKVENTVEETSLIGEHVGSHIIPANTLLKGFGLRMRMKGFISGITGTDVSIKVKLGGATILSSTQTLPITFVDMVFKVDVDFTFREVGESGLIMGQGLSTITAGKAFATSYVRPLEMSTPISIDTTQDLAFDFTYQWAVAHQNNSITATNATIELIR